MIGVVFIKVKLKQALERVRLSWKEAFFAGLAAGIAWFFASRYLHHGHPIYASMTALICLAPGLPSHGRQAIHVLTGVLTGVVVGELTLLLPVMPTELRIALVGFIALTLASAYAIVPVILLQAGMSALMVFAFGQEVAGFWRILDVLLGASIGLVFSQILFTPNQLERLNLAVERFFKELSCNYSLAAEGLENRNTKAAIRAMKSCGRTHNSLVALSTAIYVARNNAKWTLRGRFSSRKVASMSVRYDQSAIRLYASSLLLCEALVNAISKHRDEPPEWLVDGLRLAAHNARVLSGEAKLGEEFIMPDRSGRGEVALMWRECVNDFEMTEITLAKFYKSKTRQKRLDASRKKQILDNVRQEIKRRENGKIEKKATVKRKK